MAETDHQRLADELEQEGEELSSHSRELHEQAEEARADWERKRRDDKVPGAPPPSDEGAEAPKEDETPPW